MNNSELEQWIKDRDEAILSLDKEKIDAYSRKYNMGETYKPKDDLIYWAGVHKCVLAIRSASEEQKASSKKWLIEHGFKSTFDN